MMGANEIPRNIHIIWAGGNSPMPDTSIKNVLSWMLENPQFQIVLWVDEKTSSKGLEELKQEYKKLFEATYRAQQSGSKEESIPNLNFEVKDIRSDERICQQDDPLIDYEIDRPDPNYGASSDILRYRILYHYGGVYVDHDVALKDSLNDHVTEFEKNDKHVLYVDHLSQFADKKIAEEHLDLFTKEWGRVANDVFICTAGNPLMLQFINAVEHDNYQLRELKDIQKACQLAYGSQEFKDNTIERTGPGVILHVIKSPNTGVLTVDEKPSRKCVKSVKQGEGTVDVEIKPIKSRQYRLAQPCLFLKAETNVELANAGNWENVPLDSFSYGTQETIVESLSKIVEFEQKYFGILRLDDHLTMIKKLAKQASLNEDELIGKFLLNIKEIVEPNKLMVVQWVGLHEQTIGFYQENKLMDKTLFLQKDPPIKPEAILDLASSKEFFSTRIYSDRSMSLSKEQWCKIFKDTHKSEQIKRVFSRIEAGVSIINLMVNQDGILDFGILCDLQELITKYEDVLIKGERAFADESISSEENRLLREKIKTLKARLQPASKQAEFEGMRTEVLKIKEIADEKKADTLVEYIRILNWEKQAFISEGVPEKSIDKFLKEMKELQAQLDAVNAKNFMSLLFGGGGIGALSEGTDDIFGNAGMEVIDEETTEDVEEERLRKRKFGVGDGEEEEATGDDRVERGGKPFKIGRMWSSSSEEEEVQKIKEQLHILKDECDLQGVPDGHTAKTMTEYYLAVDISADDRGAESEARIRTNLNGGLLEAIETEIKGLQAGEKAEEEKGQLPLDNKGINPE